MNTNKHIQQVARKTTRIAKKSLDPKDLNKNTEQQTEESQYALHKHTESKHEVKT